MATKFRLSILSLWLGIMALFSFVVAPSAFAALPESNLAGAVVSAVLSKVEIIGIVLIVAALIALFVSREQSGKAFVFEMIALLAMGISMIFSHFVVSRRLHEIRVKFGGGTTAIPASDPARAVFDQLHQLSVGLMSFAMLATVILVVLLVRRAAKSPAYRNA
jgi:hypothetical protein